MAPRARWILPVAAWVALCVVITTPVARSQAQSPVIELLLNGRDVRTRVQAASTLGRLRPAGAREALERALGDPSPAVRATAAQSLGTLGDPRAIVRLTTHVNDEDPGVRAGVRQSILDLQSRMGTGISAATPSSTYASIGAPRNDWNRARFVVLVRSLSNNVQARSGVMDVMRSAILQEVARNPDVAAASGALPFEAMSRVQTGQLRAYAIEGSIRTLRRWTVASQLSVRAEVSLVLMSEPGRTIVGSLSGAATAADMQPPGDLETFAQRLEDRAVGGAVRGALNNLHSSLFASR